MSLPKFKIHSYDRLLKKRRLLQNQREKVNTFDGKFGSDILFLKKWVEGGWVNIKFWS